MSPLGTNLPGPAGRSTDRRLDPRPPGDDATGPLAGHGLAFGVYHGEAVFRVAGA